MKSEEFIYEDLDFYLHDDNEFEIPKDWILKCCFDEHLQSRWEPRVGDIILGCTGNLFVISNKSTLHESIGGDQYFFGGGSCSRDGSSFASSTYSYTMNRSGKKYGADRKELIDLYHSSYLDFRWIPRPENELKRARL